MKNAYAEIQTVATRAAERAADIQRRYFETGFEITRKGEVNLLTEADLASQDAIVETIRQAFPSHAILAEEKDLGHHHDLSGPLWIIDPIDGTTNYAHRFPIFGISIGFVEDGRSTFGLIHFPMLGEWYTATRGQGAYLNQKPIRVSAVDRIQPSLLATGFAYDRKTMKENNLDYFAHFEMNSLSIRRPGAASFDLACVAAGRFDGYWEFALQPWDIAAGIVLVEEAGGRISDLSGAPITDYNRGEMLATNGKIHEAMLSDFALLRKAKGIA